ncbi:MAG TPA: hypothetical protein ENJ37_09230 [Deltaproteobacteria bacterium]|nr:hypothetical protein [Deltaproteobacteria bacterium]
MKRFLDSRTLAALFVGNLVYFFVFALVCWLLTRFDVTPYGQFVAKFFKGRGKDEIEVFIKDNRELFETMMPAARAFANTYIMPSVAVVTGMVVGLVTGSRGMLTAAVTVLPVAVLFWIREPDTNRVFFIALLLLCAALGGAAGGALRGGGATTGKEDLLKDEDDEGAGRDAERHAPID